MEIVPWRTLPCAAQYQVIALVHESVGIDCFLVRVRYQLACFGERNRAGWMVALSPGR